MHAHGQRAQGLGDAGDGGKGDRVTCRQCRGEAVGAVRLHRDRARIGPPDSRQALHNAVHQAAPADRADHRPRRRQARRQLLRYLLHQGRVALPQVWVIERRHVRRAGRLLQQGQREQVRLVPHLARRARESGQRAMNRG